MKLTVINALQSAPDKNPVLKLKQANINPESVEKNHEKRLTSASRFTINPVINAMSQTSSFTSLLRISCIEAIVKKTVNQTNDIALIILIP
ncbi:MAG: hypothetical protein OdinLCB4_002190 [Candidatus Odinarchaeum yellowstonii]|uniref:Uncharacterized protein n=1 Tax=Odinarchaeota yellowstonii (strain LCB_4) TaxID=1841599 RepID=A0AAF0ID12_ODILC|nr:MAG: hypothetical protein OdinLCB4_002190 [Candidatus Odinarchaeum yellowstonii]